MSASEKLKALYEMIREHDRIIINVDENGDMREPLPSALLVAAFKTRMDILSAVLPQIVAVVESAEGLAGATDNAERNATLGDLYNALAALDEALAASQPLC